MVFDLSQFNDYISKMKIDGEKVAVEKTRFQLSETFKNFLPLKQYFFQNRWLIIFGILSLLMVDFLQVLIPLVIKRAIDLLTLKSATATILLQHGFSIVGLATLIALFRFIWRYLIFGHSRKVEEKLRNRIYEHLQTLSLSFYQRVKTGDLMAKSINDINAVRMAVGMGLVAFTDGVVLGFAAIGFMMTISLKLTLFSLIPAPIIILLSRILTRRMSAGFEGAQKVFADLTERVREAFSGIRVIKAYNRDNWQLERIEEEGRNYISANMTLARSLAIFVPMMAIFTNIGLAIVLWLGGRLAILGDMTTGDFVAFISYLNLLIWPIMAMGWVTNLLQRGSASMRRINQILDEVPEIIDQIDKEPISEIMGQIEIKDLSLKHPGQNEMTLQDINLKIPMGETLAIVGRVGSGKTTLLNALCRLLEIPTNTIFVDGRCIREIPLKTLREGIGFVTQDAFIFSDTIRNNVLFGRDDLEEDELEEILKTADILEEIREMKRGLDTPLGERGITLSGGQRQRLTIARALIKDPPILIIDDGLSMVDTSTEERILNRIFKFRNKKTNLIVSHRVSTISRADSVVVLEAGRIMERGTHSQLLEHKGIFNTLYERQLLADELRLGVK